MLPAVLTSRGVPASITKRQTYDGAFTSWWVLSALKVPGTQDLLPMPKYSWFLDNSKHIEFDDVKPRSKHFHLQCDTCSRLQAMRVKGFKTGEDTALYQAKYDAHQVDIKDFQNLEAHCRTLATHAPYQHTFIMSDDTSAIGFPHMSCRPPKATAHMSKFNVVPCLLENIGLRKKLYIYSPKALKKGGNRWCTIMYTHLRSTKEGRSPQASADTLTYIGDNYSENVNNTDFAFCANMVIHEWYSVVYLYYGLVGHTHNGIDATHKTHNKNVGATVSATLADFVNKFEHTWTAGCPEVVIDLLNLDFTASFKTVTAPISGFTNTPNDPRAAHAFMFAKTKIGTVEMRYKHTARLSGEWLGVGGKADGPGFIIIRARPHHAPAPLVGAGVPMPQKYVQQLTGAPMCKALEEHGVGYAIPWLKEAAESNSIPILEQMEQKRPEGRMGRRVKIGAGGYNAEVQLMDSKSFAELLIPDRAQPNSFDYATFWKQPQNSATAMKDRHTMNNPPPNLADQPNVRYTQPKHADVHGQEVLEAVKQAEEVRLGQIRAAGVCAFACVCPTLGPRSLMTS